MPYTVDESNEEKIDSKVELILPDEMTHNNIDPFVHIIKPFVTFIDKLYKDQKKAFVPFKGIPLKYFDSDPTIKPSIKLKFINYPSPFLYLSSYYLIMLFASKNNTL